MAGMEAVAAYPTLLSPFRIRGLQLRNRIVSSAHGLRFGDRFLPTDRDAAYYARKAAGGAGLVILEGTRTHWTSMASEKALLGILPAVTERYQMVAEAVHGQGGVIIGQLMHQGRQVGSAFHRNALWAPSPIASPVLGEVPHEMSRAEIAEVVRSFGTAAEFMKAGGLDGCEINGAHGYLVSEFLSPHSNQRTDAYGGSPANRLRFAKEILEEIRDRVGGDWVVSIRLNGDDLVSGGVHADEMAAFAGELAQAGLVDVVSASGGTYEGLGWAQIIPDFAVEPGGLVPYARAFRAAVDVPVIAVGRLHDPSHAEHVLASGDADLIAMPRALIADPDLPNKLAAGKAQDVRPCIVCNYCVQVGLLGQPLSCTVNPEIDEAAIWREPGHQQQGRRVVVVGGGPAGMEAARVAARRHEVVVLERSPQLGGQVAAAAAMGVRSEMRKLLDWQVRQLTEAGVEVRLGAPATIETITALRPDVVVVATGSSPQLPDIPTTGSPVVSSQAVVTNALKLDPQVGAVLLVDDEHGVHALSTALELMERGFAVHLVNRRLAPGADIAPNSTGSLLTRLRLGGVEFALGATVERIDGQTAVLRDVFTGELRDGPQVQAVIVVGPRRADGGELIAALEDAGIAHVAIGDAYAPRRLHQAFREGALVGRRLGVRDVDDRIMRSPAWGDFEDVATELMPGRQSLGGGVERAAARL